MRGNCEINSFHAKSYFQNELFFKLLPFHRCGHCKRLKPEYAKAAEDLIRNDPPVALVKIDCTAGGKESCNKHSVSGYPTLKIFRNGEFSQEYNGPREAPGKVLTNNNFCP